MSEQHPVAHTRRRNNLQRMAALRAAYRPFTTPDAPQPTPAQIPDIPDQPTPLVSQPPEGTTVGLSQAAARAAAERGQISWRDRVGPELPSVLQTVSGITSRRAPERTQLTPDEVRLGATLPEPQDNRPGWMRALQERNRTRRTERDAERNAERRDIIQWFTDVRGTFDPRFRYAVDASQIPNQIDAEPFDPQLQFFNRDAVGDGWHASPLVVPSAYDDTTAVPPIDTQNPRFRDAEDRVTGGDSGFFALCASAARTPQDQAKLFTVLSTAVIRMHMNHPNLITELYHAQEAPQHGNNELTSANLFREHDLARPPAERLFTYNESTNPPTIDIDRFAANEHRARLVSLLEAIRDGQVSRNDLRQLELYAHAARVEDMIDAMRRRPIRIGTPPILPPGYIEPRNANNATPAEEIAGLPEPMPTRPSDPTRDIV